MTGTDHSAVGVERIAALALDRGIRIGTAESLTCGMLASTLGQGNDASAWLAGGIVAYQTDVKERVLGLSSGTDPCSAECAEQLALGARELLDVDVAVSTTGVGGPDPQGGHDPGTVFIGWATADGTGHRLLRLDGDPSEVLQSAVDRAVDLLADLARDTRGGSPTP